MPVIVVTPTIVKNESVSVLKVISLVPDGVKDTAPVVVKVFPEPRVKSLLIVVVPDVAPRDTVVAAPPMFKVVAVVLNRLAVVLDAFKSEDAAPLMVTPLEAVTAPVKVDVPSTTRLPLAETSPLVAKVVPDPATV